MAIYIIGDLHLSFSENKPMSIFGGNWEGHEEKIKKDWIEKVTEKDLVVIPGDFSWSTYLKDTTKDFEFLNKLPGRKLLLKGNHDYWWTTVTSMRKFLEEQNIKNIDFLYNNAYKYENYIICGTRGWNSAEEGDNKRIQNRELQRLELSLKKGMEYFQEGNETIVFMHYPPTNDFIQIMKKYNVKRCYYGHLHGVSIKDAVEGEFEEINFKLVSADALDFRLEKI